MAWYNDGSDFVDPPNDPLDKSRFPSADGGLPIDFDVLNALADPETGIATKPQATGIAQAMGDGLIAALYQGVTGIINGTVSMLVGWLSQVRVDVNQQQEVINDHTNSIEQLEAAFQQLILQGNAIVYTGDNTYYPSAGIVAVDVIIIGAGAGGAGGRWEVFNGGCAGGGGGGGGEVHTTIPANLLPKTNGVFNPIAITVGEGGKRGTSSPSSGQGGGNTSFGPWLTAGGGQGGLVGPSGGDGTGGIGGAGMIPGGKGGNGPRTSNGQAGGNSTSAYDLHGGGGGGGGGPHNQVGGPGGIGGISPGGLAGNVNTRNGTAPSSIVATGGGGGAGGWFDGGPQDGGTGAFPAGGGGGGPASPTQSGNGGAGGNGILFVIEPFA